jgi:transcriptional regulator with XRE-family HTH domain
MEMESPAAGAPVDGGAPANNPTARIGQRIRRARLTRNYTQGDLARGDFSVSYVSAVERGQIRPSLGALERLSVKLRVPIAELLTDAHDAEIDAAASYTASYSAESEAVREEISARLREAQILSRQGRTDEAITVLKEVLGRLPLAGAGRRCPRRAGGGAAHRRAHRRPRVARALPQRAGQRLLPAQQGAAGAGVLSRLL